MWEGGNIWGKGGNIRAGVREYWVLITLTKAGQYEKSLD